MPNAMLSLIMVIFLTEAINDWRNGVRPFDLGGTESGDKN